MVMANQITVLTTEMNCYDHGTEHIIGSWYRSRTAKSVGVSAPHLDALGVVAEVAVLRAGLGPAGVADGGADHAGEAPERGLRPPEASQREHRRLRGHRRRRRSPRGSAPLPRSRPEAAPPTPPHEEEKHPHNSGDRRGGGSACHLAGGGSESESGYASISSRDFSPLLLAESDPDRPIVQRTARIIRIPTTRALARWGPHASETVRSYNGRPGLSGYQQLEARGTSTSYHIEAQGGWGPHGSERRFDGRLLLRLRRRRGRRDGARAGVQRRRARHRRGVPHHVAPLPLRGPLRLLRRLPPQPRLLPAAPAR